MNVFSKAAGLAMLFAGLAGSVCAQQPLLLSLERMFELAEKQNRSMAVIDLAVSEAEQGVKVAKSSRLPDLNANVALSYIGNANVFDREWQNFQVAHLPHFGNNFAFEASQVIYSGGAIAASIDLARMKHRMAMLSREEVRENVRMMLAGCYLQLYKLWNEQRVYEQNVVQTRRLIGEINAKHAQGVALRNDVTRYELQLKGYELALTQIGNSREVLNHQLAIALGLPEGTLIQVDTTMTALLPEVSSELAWQQEALLSAPVLKQSLLGVDMSRQGEKLAGADSKPSVFAFAADKLEGPILTEVPAISSNLNYWYAGVGVKYSLSSLFKTNKKVRQARAATLMAQEEHKLAQDNLRTAVKEAYVHFEEAFTVFDVQKKSLELAQQNYQVVNNRYLNGLSLITDMLDASNQKLNAELQVVNAQINILFSYCKLKRVAGCL